MPPDPPISESAGVPQVTHFDPLTFQWHYSVDYKVTYAQDSPFFHALADGKLLGSECRQCSYRYATPRVHCRYCGRKTEWFELPGECRLHSWTICYFSGRPYLDQCPFLLGLIEFPGVDTLFMTRLEGLTQDELKIGMKVRPVFRPTKTWSINDVYFVKAA